MAEEKKINEILKKEVVTVESQKPEDKYYEMQGDSDVEIESKDREYLANEITDGIKAGIADMSGLIESINECEAVYDGEVDESGGPWEGSSKFHAPVVTSKIDGLVARFNNTLTSVRPYFIFESDVLPKTKLQYINNDFQIKIENEMGFSEFIDDITLNGCKQFTALAAMTYDKDIIRRTMLEKFTNKDEFKKAYPTAESAKISSEEYTKILSDIEKYGVAELHVRFNEVISKVKYEVIDRRDFVLCPSNAKSLEFKDIDGFGYKCNLSWDDIMIGVKNGRYQQKDFDALLAKMGEKDAKKEPASVPDKTESQGETEKDGRDGLIPAQYKSKRFNAYVGVWKYDANNDGIKEPVAYTLIMDYGILLKLKYYPYWHNENYVVDFKVKRQPGRFDGSNIAKQLKPINDNIDTMNRQRNDAWTQVIDKQYKRKRGAIITPDPFEHRPRPGDVFEMENVNEDLVEFNKLPIGVPNFIQEEQLNLRYADMVSGFTEGMSGSESSYDPNAPAAKTEALLREANKIINKYVKNLRIGLNKYIKLYLWLAYQYGPEEYFGVNEKGEKVVIYTKEDINPRNIKNIRVNCIDAGLNAEVKKQESLIFLQTGMSIPLVASRPQAQRELAENYFVSWGYDPKKLKIIVPTEQEMKQELIEIQKEAIMQMQKEKIARAVARKVGDKLPAGTITPEVAQKIREQLAAEEQQAQKGGQ